MKPRQRLSTLSASMFCFGAMVGVLGGVSLIAAFHDNASFGWSGFLLLVLFRIFWPAVFLSDDEVMVRNIRTKRIALGSFQRFAIKRESRVAKSYELWSTGLPRTPVWALFNLNPFYPLTFDGNAKRAKRLGQIVQDRRGEECDL